MARHLFPVALVSTALFFIPTIFAYAADLPCDNPVTLSQDQMTVGGLVKAGQQICPKDVELGLSNDVGAAKAYLLSIARNLRDSKAPPTKERIDALNGTFAVCAANFLKAYTQRYGAIYVVSAFRCGPNSPSTVSCNRAENGAAGGASGSNHQLGLAADVNPANGDYQTLWRFAQTNPQFGVCFPYLGSDRPHMALAGTGTGEASRCAAQGITAKCSGSPDFDIKSVPQVFITSTGTYDEGDAGSSAGSCVVNTMPLVISQCSSIQRTPSILPTPSISSSLLGSSPTTPITSTPTQSQGQICTPSFSCSGGVVYYKTTQCTTQTYQVCAYGCNGNACATSSSTASTLGGVGTAFSTTSSSTNSDTNTNDDTDSEQPLVSDYLDRIGGFTATAVDIGTSSPITFRLDPATGDIVQVINGTERPALVATSGIISTVQPTLGQQTFSSGDLSSSGYYPQPQATALQSVLSGMRSALEWALSALRSLRR